jgi:two-component system cell cycle sensor histidine kinase/response regulator CckA
LEKNKMMDENVTGRHPIQTLEKSDQRIVELETLESELKQLQELLDKERETFFPILHKAPYGIALIDTNGRFIYVNPEFTNITGYTVEDIFAGRDWFHRASPFFEYRQEIIRSLKKDVIQKRVEKMFSVVCKNQEVKEIEFKPTLLDDGRIVMVFSDITERKRAEDALKESEEKYRTILENIEDGYFEVDIAGNFTFFNDSLCRMLGYSREEMMGMNDRQYTDQENAKNLYQAFNKVYRTGEAIKGFVWEVIAKDGTKLFGEVSVSLIKDSKGHPTGFRGIARDITERKRAEEEKATLQEKLRQSQKMEAIGGLAGGIAHDFNNLLTVISGNCQLSLLELKEGDSLRENVEEIKAAADRATSLTRQLLAFSRRQVLNLKVLDLNAIIRDLEKMLRRVIGEDIELVTCFADDLGMVKMDPGWIEQVIMNLAVNARDAMPGGGKLIIKTANADLDDSCVRTHAMVKPGPYVKLCVNDTGTGMAPEVKERLFEPFFTTKEKGKGTGLGLSTVYGIVKQSGGEIWVYSEPGLGTTFNIYLPRVDESVDDTKMKVTREEIPRGGETILLVEDEEDVRRLAVRILQRQGYMVLEASCGKEALALCKEHQGPIDLILTDVVMPEMSGRQLADQLTLLHPDVKVVYMSGYTDNAIIHHGVLEEGVNYIQKPFTVDGLMKKIREILDRETGLTLQKKNSRNTLDRSS